MKDVTGKLQIPLMRNYFFNTYKSAKVANCEKWAYLALGIKLNKIHKIETGPLYVTWNTGIHSWFHQYYLQITWISRFELNRKSK